MTKSAAVRTIEEFCRQWSEEPDEIRRRILLQVVGTEEAESDPNAAPTAPSQEN